MLFDAYDKAIVFLKRSPTRRICNNMKTAGETIFVGKGFDRALPR